MKTKRLFLTLFICYSTTLFGLTPPPEYIPMLVSGNQWNELAENVSLPPEYQYQRTYITKTGHDTLINGVNYSKLLTAKDESSGIWLNNGYIREDIETRKVYYKPQKDEQEVLLYNFNVLDMRVGNEIQSYDLQSKTNVLLSVGRVEYNFLGGKSRMVVTLRSTSLDVNCICYEDHVWIEGIGNTDGFLRSTMAIPLDGSDKMSLLCFSQNDELVYKPENTNVEDCFIYKYINKNTYIGKIVGKGNPCPYSDFGECPPCIVLWLETDSKDYVLSIHSNWICDNKIIVDEVEYSEGDEVEITGTVTTGQDINLKEYFTLEIETIKKSILSIEMSSSDNNKVHFDAANQLIIIDEPLQNQFTLELIDIQGKVILRKTENSISVANLLSGIYLYRLTRDGIIIDTGKILKSN